MRCERLLSQIYVRISPATYRVARKSSIKLNHTSFSRLSGIIYAFQVQLADNHIQSWDNLEILDHDLGVIKIRKPQNGQTQPR